MKYFRDNGFSVHDVHNLKNCCDLYISYKDITAAIEVKDGTLPPSARKMSEGEIKFSEEWQGLWWLCESIKDADIIIEKMIEYSLRQKENKI